MGLVARDISLLIRSLSHMRQETRPKFSLYMHGEERSRAATGAECEGLFSENNRGVLFDAWRSPPVCFGLYIIVFIGQLLKTETAFFSHFLKTEQSGDFSRYRLSDI